MECISYGKGHLCPLKVLGVIHYMKKDLEVRVNSTIYKWWNRKL